MADVKLGFWEASALLYDPYMKNLLSEDNPVYLPAAHWNSIKQTTLYQKIACVAFAILHHIKAYFSKEYKEKFTAEAQKVNQAFQLFMTPPKVISKTLSIDEFLASTSSIAFSEAWKTLICRAEIEKISSFNGTHFYTFKKPCKLRVYSNDSSLKGNAAVLLIGCNTENLLKFHFKKDTVTTADQSSNISAEEFQQIKGKPITRIQFDKGFSTYVYFNGAWPLNRYYSPEVKEIGYIDDTHVLIKGALDLKVGNWEEKPRLHTVAELKKNWEEGVLINDEVKEFKVD